MKKVLLFIVSWTWCFPQQFFGLIVRLFSRAKKQEGGYYTYGIDTGSLSLGTYIFLCDSHKNDEEMLKHEKGHTIQSYILGWLWLPIIGIPSLIWAGCFGKWRIKHSKSYYWLYTEAWANRLGGIAINKTHR